MPNIDIKHVLVAVDYPGSGAIAENQDLDAVEWNRTHFTVSAGNGIEVVSDGASPPTLVWKIGGSQTSFGGDLLPSIDDMWHVGTKTLRWRAGYFARAVSVGATLALLPNDIKVTSGNLTFSKEGVGSFTWDGLAIIPGGASNDIGALANLWRAGYFSSTLSAGGGFRSNATSILATINPGADALYSLGTSVLRWNDFRVSTVTISSQLSMSGAQIIQAGDILPATDGTAGIGSTTARFGSGFFGGTLSAGSGFQTNAADMLTYRIGRRITQDGTNLTFEAPVEDGAFIFRPRTGSTVSQTRIAQTGVGGHASVELHTSTGAIGSILQSTISAGGGFQTNASPGYLGTGIPAFKAQAGADSTKFLQFYHDGTTAVISLSGTSAISYIAGVAGLHDYGSGDSLRIHGPIGTPFGQIGHNNFQLTISQSSAPSGLYIQSHVSAGGHLTPDIDATYDNGSPSKRWRYGFFATTVSIGGSQNLASSLVIDSDGTVLELPLTDAGRKLKLMGSGNAGLYFGTISGSTWALDNNGGIIRLFQPGTVYFEIRTDEIGPPTGRDNLADLANPVRRFRNLSLGTSLGVGVSPSGVVGDAFFAGLISAGGTGGGVHYFKQVASSEIARFDSTSTNGIVRITEGGVFRAIIGYGDNGGILTGQTTDSVVLRAEGDLFFAAGGDNLGAKLDTARVLSVGGGFQTNSGLAYQLSSNTDVRIAWKDSSGNEQYTIGGNSGFGGRFSIVSNRDNATITIATVGPTPGTSIERVRFQAGNAQGSSPVLFFETVSAGGAFQTNVSTSIFQDIQITALFPDLTDVRNIGSSAKKFQHGFFAGTVSAASVVGATTLSLVAKSGSITLDTSGGVADLLFTGGSGTSFRSTVDNTNDLGNPAAKWRNVHFATQASFGGITGQPGFASNTSVSMAFGGASVGGSAPGAATDKIPIMVNGVVKYIMLSST